MTPRTLLTVTLLASLAQAAPPAEILPLPRPEPSARQLLEPVPFLRAPFDGEFKVTSFFDHRHETPKKDEKRQTSFWGTPTHGHTGHHGYDWSMPEGTPLFAVADGVVESAGHEPSFTCYISGDEVDDQLSIVLRHEGPDGKTYHSRYTHLSATTMAPGQLVQAG
jgi:murein DD-endopeptidase MepM/ murein hydrolase activator NlpD